MNLTKLAEEAIAGNSSSFISLIKELERPLHYMAKSIVRNDEDVADALQEAILKAYKSVHTLREPKYFKTWMFRILINECHTILAGRNRSIAYAEVPEPSAITADYEQVDLREAVDRLEEQQRIVIILHYFEDLPLRQIAQILSLSESAVKMRLHRARESLLRNFTSNHKGELHLGTI